MRPNLILVVALLSTTGQSFDDSTPVEGDSMSDMGILHTTVLIENPLRRGDLRALSDTLVDTGAELPWAPRAVMEDLGVQAEKRKTFQGMNLRVDPRNRQLVAAGPIVAAQAGSIRATSVTDRTTRRRVQA